MSQVQCGWRWKVVNGSERYTGTDYVLVPLDLLAHVAPYDDNGAVLQLGLYTILYSSLDVIAFGFTCFHVPS